MSFTKLLNAKLLSILLGMFVYTNGAAGQTPFLQTPVPGMQNKQYFIMNYPDEDSTMGYGDFRCGSVSYEAHQGTDFGLRDFAVMDSGVTVIAAAPGIVIAAVDGLFDRSKAAITGGYGNYVAVNSNGYLIYYAHLKKNTILVKVGDTLQVGDIIGQVGSSGKSSDPHLHFEIQKNGRMVDPWAGACNPAASLWVAQEAYTDTLLVMDAGFINLTPTLDTLRERPPTIRTFIPSDVKVWFWVHTLNIHAGDTCSAYWYRPDGTEHYHYHHVQTADLRYSWDWFNIYALKTMPEGVWKVVYKHNGREIFSDLFTFQLTGTAPKISSTPIETAIADRTYSYHVVADGIPEASFRLREQPADMSVQPFTGSLAWLPSRGRKGLNTVIVRAENSAGYDEQTFQIDVWTAPRISSSAPVSALVSHLYQYTVVADAYPAARYSLLNAPPSMSIDSIQGTIQWRPDNKDTGMVVFSVIASNAAGMAIHTEMVDVRLETAADHEVQISEFSLHQNYPNPFRTETILRFSFQNFISKATLKIFDVLGRDVVTLYEGPAASGEHIVRFTPPRENSGVFYYQLGNGTRTITRMMQSVR